MSRIVGVLLAAGAGSRFGRSGPPKVLRPFRGRPLLTWPLAALRDGGVDDVVVVLGARADEVSVGVDLGDADVVRCDDWAEGLSASLRAGVQAAIDRSRSSGVPMRDPRRHRPMAEEGADPRRRGPTVEGEVNAVVIVLADQPLLDARAVARLIAARELSRFDALRATYAGVPGHPILLESSTFGAIGRLRGDAGARALLDDPATRVGLIACDGLGRPDDVDTPEALARLEALA